MICDCNLVANLSFHLKSFNGFEILPGAHQQERHSPILGLAINTVAKVFIFRFAFPAKQTKGLVSDQSQAENLLRHSSRSVSILFYSLENGRRE